MDLAFVLLIAAWGIDLFWGEYPNRLHPVVWMGQSISLLAQRCLGFAPWVERLFGMMILALIALGFAALSALSIAAMTSWPLLSFALAIFWLKSSFALRALGEAAQQVQRALGRGQIDGARSDLRALCSRDAAQLDEQQLTEASISSLAENLSDSFIAPLFYFLIGGVPAAVFYRAVNTLDAMIGYKNHYRHLGWASARCDDLLNWIPARISVLLLLLAGLCRGHDARRAFTIARRDHAQTPSPNGGWPMAAMAGLLAIRLQKPGVYTLGDALRPSELSILSEAWRVTRLAGIFGLIASLLFLLPGFL